MHTLTKGWTGTRLIREWRGRTYEVVVLDDGFSWQGFTALRVFHLSNVGAHPSKRLGARRAGLELRQVEHANTSYSAG